MAAYFPMPDAEDDIEHLLDDLDEDPRTQLDKTIDRIGMGRYQWTLLCLCGFGWMADNMWLQAVAIVLPRVQLHYSVPDSYIGIASSAMFAGMMLGAIGWGTCSDLIGRSTAFNATLFFTAPFRIRTRLCVFCFFSWGSIPTDGTLLLEHMPQHKLHLVTGLSLFFSVGSVLTALFALVLVPPNSCASIATACDLALNNGWKHLLTLAMFVARIVLFRLHESPRLLVHAGRPAEALEVLQLIARFNGAPALAGELGLADVDDTAKVVLDDEEDDGVGYEAIGGSGKGYVPQWAQRWFARVQMVLVPEWRRTSLLLWAAWCGMALAYTLFDVFLPKLLESSGTKTIEEGLWDVLIYTIGGCPGPLLGARLILTPLGRRWSLAGSTLVTAGFCTLFVFAQKADKGWAVRVSAIGVGLASTTMWAVLYGWTPEIFATKVRGTACGIASALSRIGGMIGPILGGILLLFSRAAPVYTSVIVFVLAAACVLLLSEDEGEGGRNGAPVDTVLRPPIPLLLLIFVALRCPRKCKPVSSAQGPPVHPHRRATSGTAWSTFERVYGDAPSTRTQPQNPHPQNQNYNSAPPAPIPARRNSSDPRRAASDSAVPPSKRDSLPLTTPKHDGGESRTGGTGALSLTLPPPISKALRRTLAGAGWVSAERREREGLVRRGDDDGESWGPL
ncbi:major facilitator superfamily domain-containing protein [Mycena haematopus]|nr:major facilitator superfamily domain-containing protein [Mycena haematopus]